VVGNGVCLNQINHGFAEKSPRGIGFLGIADAIGRGELRAPEAVKFLGRDEILPRFEKAFPEWRDLRVDSIARLWSNAAKRRLPRGDENVQVSKAHDLQSPMAPAGSHIRGI
jgi:hypothetical protein